MMLDSYVTLGKRIQPLRTRFSVNERASWCLPWNIPYILGASWRPFSLYLVFLCLNHFDIDILWENLWFYDLTFIHGCYKAFYTLVASIIYSVSTILYQSPVVAWEKRLGISMVSNNVSGKFGEAEPATLGCSDAI